MLIDDEEYLALFALEETPGASSSSSGAQVPPRVGRVGRKCSVCRLEGHFKNHCPQRDPARQADPTVVVPTGDFDEDEMLEAKEDEEADDDDNEEDEEAEDDSNGYRFPPQLHCATEDGWEDVRCVEEEYTDMNTGGRDHPNLGDILPIFNATRSGVRSIPLRCKSPLDFFMLFLTVTQMNYFVAATNMEAATSGRKKGWASQLILPEFKKFLALILFFGLVDIPEDKQAFDPQSPYYMSFVTRIMNRTRFKAIVASWKWDASVYPPDVKKIMNRDDSFWSVRGCLEAVARNFEEYYTPYQKLSLDEACIPFKGRHMDRVYNASKPNKWHLKLYMLNCAANGYCLDFFMHQLRDPKSAGPQYPSLMSKTAYPVIRLVCNKMRFHNRGHILFTDNWYTSIFVVLQLLLHGIHFIGTVLSNRKGLPKEGLLKKSCRISRGTIKHMRKVIEGTILLLLLLLLLLLYTQFAYHLLVYV